MALNQAPLVGNLAIFPWKRDQFSSPHSVVSVEGEALVTAFLMKEAEHLFLCEPCRLPLHRPFVANTVFFTDVWLALPCLGIRKGVKLVRLTNGFLSGQPNAASSGR